MAKVAVIGDGQMGLVLAMLLDEKGLQPVVWGPFSDDVAALRESKRSLRLPEFRLPDGVIVEDSGEKAMRGAAFVISAIPTQFSRSVWTKLGTFVPQDAILVSVAKGVEESTLLTPVEVLDSVLSGTRRAFVCVSGPTIATELVQHQPATVVAASENQDAARAVQDLLTISWLRVYTHDDVRGVELAGATKNVIALAAGIVDGLELGYNAKSALLARGLAEIARLGVACGARAETFFGIAGVGDLATTCFSPHSRNRTCGERLGRGERLDDILASTKSVVEGVATTRSVKALAEKHAVDLPITNAVHGILFEGLRPKEAISLLMEREPKAEKSG